MKYNNGKNKSKYDIDLIDFRLVQISQRIRELLEPSSGIEWPDTTFNQISQFTQNINEHWYTDTINCSMSNAIKHSGVDISTLANTMTRAGISWNEIQGITHLLKLRKNNAVYQ